MPSPITFSQPIEEKKRDSQTTFRRPSPITFSQQIEEKKQDPQTTFRRPSPIAFSQPIEKDSTEYLTRKSTKFQRPSLIRYFGQDNCGLVETSPCKSDTFRIPSPISISKNEHKVQPQLQSSSRTSQFTESSIITGKKRVIKPITEIIDDDDEFKQTVRPNKKSNIMDKTKFVEKYNKNSIRANNSNGTTSAFTNSNETVSTVPSKVELKTKNVQFSLIDDFYEPSKSIKRSRNSIEQKSSRIPSSKNTDKKPGIKDKKSVKVTSCNEKRKDSGIVNKQSPSDKAFRQISSDDDFVIISPHKPKGNSKNKKNYDRAQLSQTNSDDSDFLDKSPSKRKDLRSKKKRDNFRVSSYQSNSDEKKRYNLRRKPNLSNNDFMDISPQNTKTVNDELNNQREEFRAPSPTSNKYADLPEMDLLSEEETPVQSNSRKKREGIFCYDNVSSL
jgi:hypothetical protein